MKKKTTPPAAPVERDWDAERKAAALTIPGLAGCYAAAPPVAQGTEETDTTERRDLGECHHVLICEVIPRLHVILATLDARSDDVTEIDGLSEELYGLVAITRDVLSELDEIGEDIAYADCVTYADPKRDVVHEKLQSIIAEQRRIIAEQAHK